MIDIKLVRENPKEIRKNLALRNDKKILKKLDRVIEKDKQWRKLKKEADKLRGKRNQISKKINQAKKQGRDTAELIKQAKQIPERIQQIEEKEKKIEEEIKDLMLQIPNLLDKSVPKGKSEKDNKIIRKYLKPIKQKVKGHEEILKSLDIGDIARASKVSGSRFFYLKNELVKLDYALMMFALDFLKKKNYNLIEPPYMIRREAYEGAVVLADFEDMIYKIQDEDLYLIATSEHSLAPLHMNEILNLKKPLKYAGISPCFRKEAGSHGKDTKGIFRVHQFNKVEQFIFCKPEEAEKLHEEMIKNAEEIFKKLNLPYRIVILCSADTGKVSSKTYDLELWMPAQNAYREAVSASNCTEYQARRLNIKYEEKGKRKFCHTLNSTAIATSRALVAILENFQQKDGSIKIPSCLWKYTGFKVIKPKTKTKK